MSIPLSGDYKNFDYIRSMKLITIEENKLKIILRLLNIHLLVSFSFEFVKSNNYHQNATATYLSWTFTRSHLRKLELNRHSGRIEGCRWMWMLMSVWALMFIIENGILTPTPTLYIYDPNAKIMVL